MQRRISWLSTSCVDWTASFVMRPILCRVFFLVFRGGGGCGAERLGSCQIHPKEHTIQYRVRGVLSAIATSETVKYFILHSSCRYPTLVMSILYNAKPIPHLVPNPPPPVTPSSPNAGTRNWPWDDLCCRTTLHSQTTPIVASVPLPVCLAYALRRFP